jgi:hypothetical protein
METERIERKGFLGFGYSSYIAEIKKPKVSTEKVKVYNNDAVEMPDYCGNKINYLI